MSFEEFISDVAKIVEAIGVAIMVVGGMWVLGTFIAAMSKSSSRLGAYELLRRRLGEVILLGLEVLIIGDIVRTIVVDPTIESVAVLGLIVVIRIVLSFSLEVEIEGAWPWNRARLKQ
jgi:uncharacterized membrane protein